MRNTLAPRVQIELYRDGSDSPAVVGTDYIVSIDGRWSHDRAVAHIEDVARQATENSGLKWHRSVYLLGNRYLSVMV
jgi:2-polyprenyl-6-methoxyphenol hydroxylase-like FAD-dependent oxidoreductase